MVMYMAKILQDKLAFLRVSKCRVELCSFVYLRKPSWRGEGRSLSLFIDDFHFACTLGRSEIHLLVFCASKYIRWYGCAPAFMSSRSDIHLGAHEPSPNS